MEWRKQLLYVGVGDAIGTICSFTMCRSISMNCILEESIVSKNSTNLAPGRGRCLLKEVVQSSLDATLREGERKRERERRGSALNESGRTALRQTVLVTLLAACRDHRHHHFLFTPCRATSSQAPCSGGQFNPLRNC